KLVTSLLVPYVLFEVLYTLFERVADSPSGGLGHRHAVRSVVPARAARPTGVAAALYVAGACSGAHFCDIATPLSAAEAEGDGPSR
ncbi:hypothetical protein, partial [Streptomyces parvus]|uniref:hypothetical protein n=1 Tax=Streptomyces parvus TaxID=66428 RepID=UPI00344BB850